MKQYIMGLITGASLLACAFVFMGTGRFNPNHIGRYVKIENVAPQYISILDTSTGNVFASELVSKAANKYSFQHNTKDRINAETIPGKTIGSTILLKDPQTVSPSTRAASSSSIGTALN